MKKSTVFCRPPFLPTHPKFREEKRPGLKAGIGKDAVRLRKASDYVKKRPRRAAEKEMIKSMALKMNEQSKYGEEKQAYEFLKALPDYAAAQDILEEMG